MANSEDVLERADAVDLSRKQGWFVSRSDSFDLIAALAAEVRELRRDRARLDWLDQNLYVADGLVHDGTPDEMGWREAIDSAMGGEGEA